MGLKVVVALHPRADFSGHPECYEGFVTMRFKTAELIKDCEFAITHCSDALSYTVLYHKPCLSVEATMVKGIPHIAHTMKMIQKQFHIHGIDTSNEGYKDIALQDYLKVDHVFLDECIREYYYRDYVNENTEIKPLWEQAEECIKQAVEIKWGKMY